jgi:hypothetical protein
MLAGRHCVVQILCCWAGQVAVGAWGSPSLGVPHPLSLLLCGDLHGMNTQYIAGVHAGSSSSTGTRCWDSYILVGEQWMRAGLNT